MTAGGAPPWTLSLLWPLTVWTTGWPPDLSWGARRGQGVGGKEGGALGAVASPSVTCGFQ